MQEEPTTGNNGNNTEPTVEVSTSEETERKTNKPFRIDLNMSPTDSMAFYQQPQWGYSGFSPYRPSPYKPTAYWPQDTICQMRTHGEEVEDLKRKIAELEQDNVALRTEVTGLKEEREKRKFMFTGKHALYFILHMLYSLFLSQRAQLQLVWNLKHL